MAREECWKTASAAASTSQSSPKVSIDQLDFRHHKSRPEQKDAILALPNLDFINQRRDVILIGHPGTGETLLAKCIAMAACNANCKVFFTTAIDI